MSNESDHYGMTPEDFDRTKQFLFVQALLGDQGLCAGLLAYLIKRIDNHERLDGYDQGALITCLQRVLENPTALRIASGAKRGRPKT